MANNQPPDAAPASKTPSGLPKSNAGAALGGAGSFIFIMIAQAVAYQLGAGKVPLSESWQWTIPIILALLGALVTVLTPYARMYGNGGA